MNNFNINDKVVCIDDDFKKSWAPACEFFTKLPQKNEIYVIRELTKAKNGEPGVKLVGIYGLEDDGGMFHLWRFVKLEVFRAQNTIENTILNG